MTDPKRWTDGEDASFALERRLLRSELLRSPPAGLEDAGWAELSAKIAAGSTAVDVAAQQATSGVLPAAEAGSVAASATMTGVITALKAAAVGAGVGALLLSGLQWANSARPPSASNAADRTVSSAQSLLPRARAASSGGVTPAAPVISPRSEPAAAAAKAAEARDGAGEALAPTAPKASAGPRATTLSYGVVLTPEAAASSNPTPAGAAAPSAAASFGDESAAVVASSAAPPAQLAARRYELKQEALELAAAKNLLQARSGAEAYRALIAGARRFPHGALSQEREVLLVEALMQLGRTELARERARSFLSMYPRSPLSLRMRKFVEP